MTLLIVVATCLGCLVLEWFAITRLIRDRRRAYPCLPYISALVETSLPLAALIITAQYVGPAYALLTPAPLVYPLLIVLSTLRLDARLFMAVFGAPLSEGGDCLNGVAAAREILMRVEEEVASGNVLPTTVGIGLHAGEAVTGSIGSSLRKEYTVIGDVVNLASRIEKLNKKYQSRLLVSENVWQSLEGNSTDAIPMGNVRVQGREKGIGIYQLA